MVSVMDSLCYATEHADRAVLSRQLELCRTLTGEFRMHYPKSVNRVYGRLVFVASRLAVSLSKA